MSCKSAFSNQTSVSFCCAILAVFMVAPPYVSVERQLFPPYQNCSTVPRMSHFPTLRRRRKRPLSQTIRFLTLSIYLLYVLEAKLAVSTFIIDRHSLSTATNLWNVDSRPEKFQVLPHLCWFVFGIQNGQFCKHAHMCSLQTKCCLQ